MVDVSLAPTNTGTVPATLVTPGNLERVLLMSTPGAVRSGRRFGGGAAAGVTQSYVPARSVPVPLFTPRELNVAGSPRSFLMLAATEITHGIVEYGLIALGVSPALPAEKTTEIPARYIWQVAKLIGFTGSRPPACSRDPQELLTTRMLYCW